MTKIRAAVVGAGSFGRNHVRVISQLAGVSLSAIVDTDPAKAQALAEEYDSQAFADLRDVIGSIDAAIVATPTRTHESITSLLLDSGIDVLVEKPIAESSAAGQRMADLAKLGGRILQVGHLERFNPAVTALERALTLPLFFEVHRLSIFSPRSLDVDVILDLMIHDLDIVLTFVRDLPNEVRAAGISVLSKQVDIANVRLSFASGCVANLTASRVSTEQVRKLRLFQPGEYISVDYKRQDLVRLAIRKNEPIDQFVWQNQPSQAVPAGIGFESLPVDKREPLELELAAFFSAVRDRSTPRVAAGQAVHALKVAEVILGKIKEHADLVSQTIRRRG